MNRLACSLLLVPMISSAGCNSDPRKSDLDRLQGYWTVESRIFDGGPDGVKGVKGGKGSVWKFVGSTMFYNPHDHDGARSTFKLDATKSPKHFDFETTNEPGGESFEYTGIYDIDGDTVKFCVARGGQPRPTSFESPPGSGLIYTVIKRWVAK